MDYIEQFRAAMCAAGLEPPAMIEADGQLHSFSTNGKPQDDAGRYILHMDNIPAGFFCCHRAGISQYWRADIDRRLSPQEEAVHRTRMDSIKANAAKRHAEAAIKASRIWENAQPASADHPYAVSKSISIDGLRSHYDALVIPVRDANGALCSLQFITPDRNKKFLTGGRVSGCFHLIGEPGGAICIAEGFATGASVNAATGYAVAVAFNAGNLLPVAISLREKVANERIILCSDLDQSGGGQAKAHEAAKAVGGIVALPDFTADELAREKPPSDFNDLAALRGPEAVAACLRRATVPHTNDSLAAAAAGAGEAESGMPADTQAETPASNVLDFDAAVARLAALKAHEYDRIRALEAKKLRVRTATLDDAVAG